MSTIDFMEIGGGHIVSNTGKSVLKINVEQLTVKDSERILRAVMNGLKEEFKNELVVGGSPDGKNGYN